MEDYYSRSRSYSDARYNMQIEVHRGSQNRGPSYDARSYSNSYADSRVYHDKYNYNHNSKELKLKKKNESSSWSLINDPELQRKKRVASYKVYSVEGNVKGSFRNSFRWLKNRYTQVVYGWW